MTKKKDIIVKVQRTNHKTQPYVVTIYPVGKAEPYKLKQRYAKTSSAKRGALTHFDARTSGGVFGREFRYSGGYVWFDVNGRRIVFVMSKTKKR